MLTPSHRPVVEIGLNGYAHLGQIGSGLRQRIYSRAFIIADRHNSNNTFVYIVADAQSGDTAVRHGVLQGLASLGGEYTRYGEQNVALTGTHSHSGPGAWMNYLLPQIPSKGFDKQSYQALVDGVLLSIQQAHSNLAPGRLSFGSIRLEGANINRSPFAYEANPEDEKARYSSDVEKNLTLLRFDRESDNKTTGVLTFFPVHPTSLYSNNTLISGDNKGVAAYLLERSVRNDTRFADGFVAGFSQASVGDTSPNTLGAWCEGDSEDYAGQQCRYEDSTCGGKTQPCHGRGPYFREDDAGAKSCFEIGRLQYAAAKELYDRMDTNATQVLEGSKGHVSSFHIYHNLSGYNFESPYDSRTLTTCSAALGFAFAGGTTDGPGKFDFTQNNTGPAESNPLWYAARAFLHNPTKEQKECQAPKGILLDVGSAVQPYPWTPNVVDIQILRVGQLLIIVSASEATTMSGRRWKDAIATSAKDVLSISEPLVVLGGPANSYAHYITTEEEYGVQRYEGGSTLYGPHTLAAYVNLTLTYLPYLGGGVSDIASEPRPPINTNVSMSFIKGVKYDGTDIGKSFGDLLLSSKPDTIYKPGDTVRATFVGANPRNDLRLERTFVAVEKINPISGYWETVRDDSDWNLLYHWKRTNTLLGSSEVTVEWQIEDDFYNVGNPQIVEDGIYRLRYFGDFKNIIGTIEPFTGIGERFIVGAVAT